MQFMNLIPNISIDYLFNHLHPVYIFCFYLFVMNLSLFVMMGWDKWMAIKNASRIPEQTLLALGFFGGGLGGLVAIFLFRHKIRKPYFAIVYIAGIVLGLLVYHQFFASLF